MTATLPTLQSRAHISNSPLEAMLRAIGVEPIPQALVDDYMEQELHNAPPSAMLGRYLHRHGYSDIPFDDFLRACLGFLCVMGLLTFGIGLIIASWLAAGAGVVLAIITAMLWAAMRYGTFLIIIARGPAYWRITSTEYMYVPALPYFVRERMELVQLHITGVHFKVADLRQNCYSLDPVLFALLGDKQCAICVWKGREEIRLS